MNLIFTLAFCYLWAPTDLNQPAAQKKEQHDTYHGIRVSDPYRHLEEMDAPEVRKWVLGQDAYARRYVKSWAGHKKVTARMAELGGVLRYISPVRAGKRFFYNESTPGVGRGTVWMKSGSGKATAALLKDDIGKDRELRSFTPSPDGAKMAYVTTGKGARAGMVLVRDLETGQNLKERLVGFHSRLSSLTWSRDSLGFYYNRYRQPKQGKEQETSPAPMGVYYHRLGGDQSGDVKVFELPDLEDWYFGHSETSDGAFTVLVGRNGEQRAVYVRRDKGFEKLLEVKAAISFLGNVGQRLFFQTSQDAPKGRIVSLAVDKPSDWRTVVAEGKHTLISASMEDDMIVTTYRKDAMPALSAWRVDGSFAYDIELPKIAATSVFAGQAGDGEMMLTMSNLTDPGSVWRLNLADGVIKPLLKARTNHNPDAFETRQVFYKSKDGTRVPMFLVQKKGGVKSTENPLFMYGYGAGNWAAFPWYQTHLVAWLEMGGVYAMPGIRGGGEYGDAWHQAGIRRNKQNAIDDFVWAARWLIEQGHTSAGRLVVNGGSASGPLVGAAMVQEPELFGAVLIEWPALDMVRFDQYPGGQFWQWGNGSTSDADDFKSLYAWSPYHNIKKGVCYPPTMLVLGENDESTIPAHGYKFQAALQGAMGCDHPALMRMIWSGGHYQYGVTNQDSRETLIDILAFLGKVLEMDPSI